MGGGDVGERYTTLAAMRVRAHNGVSSHFSGFFSHGLSQAVAEVGIYHESVIRRELEGVGEGGVSANVHAFRFTCTPWSVPRGLEHSGKAAGGWVTAGWTIYKVEGFWRNGTKLSFVLIVAREEAAI